MIARLKLNDFPAWESSMETLRLLANCYKHDPSRSPDEDLLKHLKLDPTVMYASLPESRCFRKGLALSLDLEEDADYCAIAEELLARAEHFLADVEQQPAIGKVKWGPTSLSPDEAVCRTALLHKQVANTWPYNNSSGRTQAGSHGTNCVPWVLEEGGAR